MGTLKSKIEYPAEVCEIIGDLGRFGHQAYAVGGCIRDSLMERNPSDWDITTSATPDEMFEIFKQTGKRTFSTGLKHGTITVLCGKSSFECTTYRTESEYSDGRHPDNVSFSRELSDDLCRRDFTINAMAGAPMCDIVDLYGGRDDIENEILRCVGDPSVRFGEDALRILRAVRFATVLNFKIDRATAHAIIKKKDMLSCISAERKSAEFCKILMSDHPDRGLELLYKFGLTDHILFGMTQTKGCLDALPKKLPLRLAAALLESPDISLSPLKLSNAISSSVKRLLIYPRYTEPCEMSARFLIHDYGELAEDVCHLYGLLSLLPYVDGERQKNSCVTLCQLALDGRDLLLQGFSGKEIKRTLDLLLLEVIRNPSLNTRESLLSMARKRQNEEVEKCTE